MKLLPLSIGSTLLFALTAFTARAADTPLEKSMKEMSHAGKQLGADLKLTDDTKHDKQTDLASVATIKTESIKAHDLVPKKEKALPAEQQAAMQADYQKDMDSFVKDVDTLNADITADKWDASRADFQKLMDDEKDGHKKFRVKK